MKIHRSDDLVEVFAPAKVNLHLEVLGKRANGFHEIETLMVSVSLFDRLIVRTAASGTELWCSDPDAGPADQNLVTRAVELMRSESGRTDGLRIELKKEIPVSAGLAGGSSDAAATIAAINELWNLSWTNERLGELSSRLGSDIPFFFHTPAAVAKGRGEKIEPVKLGAALDLVLIAPHEGLSTKEVYSRLSVPPRPTPLGPMIAALESGNKMRIAGLLHNRLMEPAMGMSQSVRAIFADAGSWPCLGHLMSGSGSACFALCESAAAAEELGNLLRPKGLGRVFVVETSR